MKIKLCVYQLCRFILVHNVSLILNFPKTLYIILVRSIWGTYRYKSQNLLYSLKICIIRRNMNVFKEFVEEIRRNENNLRKIFQTSSRPKIYSLNRQGMFIPLSKTYHKFPGCCQNNSRFPCRSKVYMYLN